jgi:hypothetical protein
MAFLIWASGFSVESAFEAWIRAQRTLRGMESSRVLRREI